MPWLSLCVLTRAREGEGLDAATALDGGQIGLGGVHLVHAHAVADEVKHVLRPLLGEGHGGKGQTEAESEEFAFHLVWMDCGWMNVSWGKVTFFLAHALLCAASICVRREQTAAPPRLPLAFFRWARRCSGRWRRALGGCCLVPVGCAQISRGEEGYSGGGKQKIPRTAMGCSGDEGGERAISDCRPWRGGCRSRLCRA